MTSNNNNRIFFILFRNIVIRKVIFDGIKTNDRNVYNRSLSAQSLKNRRYHMIKSADWIVRNGYFSLLREKIRMDDHLIYSPEFGRLLSSNLFDLVLFQWIYERKPHLFAVTRSSSSGSTAPLLECACESGNIAVVRFYVEKVGWRPTTSSCIEKAIDKDHYEVVRYLVDRCNQIIDPTLIARSVRLSAAKTIRFFVERSLPSILRDNNSINQYEYLFLLNIDYPAFQKVYNNNNNNNNNNSSSSPFNWKAPARLANYHQYLRLLADYNHFKYYPNTLDHFRIIDHIETFLNPKTKFHLLIQKSKEEQEEEQQKEQVTQSSSSLQRVDYQYFIKWLINSNISIIYNSNAFEVIMKGAIVTKDLELVEMLKTKKLYRSSVDYQDFSFEHESLEVTRYLVNNSIGSAPTLACIYNLVTNKYVQSLRPFLAKVHVRYAVGLIAHLLTRTTYKEILLFAAKEECGVIFELLMEMPESKHLKTLTHHASVESLVSSYRVDMNSVVPRLLQLIIDHRNDQLFARLITKYAKPKIPQLTILVSRAFIAGDMATFELLQTKYFGVESTKTLAQLDSDLTSYLGQLGDIQVCDHLLIHKPRQKKDVLQSAVAAGQEKLVNHLVRTMLTEIKALTQAAILAASIGHLPILKILVELNLIPRVSIQSILESSIALNRLDIFQYLIVDRHFKLEQSMFETGHPNYDILLKLLKQQQLLDPQQLQLQQHQQQQQQKK
ncbi:hypothetical protein DFA_08731 [Cavenderia fasciculata]|uniref:Ankyrin repeat-containing protein n=1 Tax=Cavenderia fasciculata TaxID=261658 RepID=F4Q3X6_CACFS|nr:uncharacterized protein DFA_08731 [Cavenderia fasciculata]EGG17732.1 hypothetical protein DFA_08731 [Cavenderia fasciculata]|eukprot:XP_004356216.1 hypothetical protein DFA_08731 [Cavenderia fasciculata]